MDDASGEVIRVEAQDLVPVQILFRRTGVVGGANPFGHPKLELLLPRTDLEAFQRARQFQTPEGKNLNILFDGQLIRPPIVSAKGASSGHRRA